MLAETQFLDLGSSKIQTIEADAFKDLTSVTYRCEQKRFAIVSGRHFLGCRQSQNSHNLPERFQVYRVRHVFRRRFTQASEIQLRRSEDRVHSGRSL